MFSKSNSKNILFYFPLLLFALNVVLKVLYLTTAAIGHDEPFSIYHAQFNIEDILHQIKKGVYGNNPPLFEIILHYWIKLFGISPTSLRALPALFACLSPVALY